MKTISFVRQKKHTKLMPMLSGLLISVLCLNLFLVAPQSVKADNVDSDHNDAWSEQGGWLDFGVFTVTDTEILQDSTGTGSNAATFHQDATYYTKVHGLGGQAALSGWAWASNIGWIQMSSSTASDNTQTGATIIDPASQDNVNYGVYIDTNGYFRGYAWSESAGWVSFYDGISSTAYTATTWRASSVPDAPVLVSPSDDARLDDATPTLTFNLNDPDGDAVKYQVQIGTDATVSTGSRVVDFTEASTQALPRNGVTHISAHLSSGTYYWRVRAIDAGTLEGAWSTINYFVIDTDLPVSKILYPQHGVDLSKVEMIRGQSKDNDGIDFTRISIFNVTSGKYYDGASFDTDTEVWITTSSLGVGTTTSTWKYPAPSWLQGNTYTVRSRATDMAGNEEHTDAVTFTYDTVNGEAGSIYVSNPAVNNNSDYIIYYPNTSAIPVDSYIEIDFDDSFRFSPWLEDANVTLSDDGGNITASSDVFDRENKTITSIITGGSVGALDLIELSISPLRIHNPSATGSYVLPIRIYNSVGGLIEFGSGTIILEQVYQQVELNIDVQQSLQLSVDSGAVLLSVDPDVQLGQNWVGTDGAVSEKTDVTVKTNAISGYNLMISLAGNTATGSAILDGTTNTGNQITSSSGNRVSVENNFTFSTNSGSNATGVGFNNSSTQVSGAGTSAPTNTYVDNIYYYLNIDYTTPSDTYQGTVTYTAVGQF